MKPLRYLVIILSVIITTTPISCVSNIDGSVGTDESDISQSLSPAYYPEGPRFEFGIMIIGDKPSTSTASLLGSYLQQSIFVKKEVSTYYFKILETDYQIGVTIPVGIADNIKLVPDNKYQVVYNPIMSPDGMIACSLIILEESELVFAGITDLQIDEFTKTDSAFIPIKVELYRVLTDHFIERPHPCWDKFTNTEIMFSLAGDSVTLHQGESAMLGGYEINLAIAREVQVNEICEHVGPANGISYTISRIS